MNWGRRYYAVQALAGALWWAAVFSSPFVREATLGELDPVIVAVVDIPLFVIASALAAFGARAAASVATGWTLLVASALAVYATVTMQAGWGVLTMAAAASASLIAWCLMRFGRVPTQWLIRGPFAFRPAARVLRSASYLTRTFGQIIVFWGLFLAVFPVVIAFLERRWGVDLQFSQPVHLLGLAVLLAASALGIWSAVVMATLGDGTPLPSAMPSRLVIAGPYRWVRNPMALAGIVQGAAIGLLLSSWLVIVYAIAGSLLWNYAIRPLEEADLLERFGGQFERYRDRVRCWVPRIPRP